MRAFLSLALLLSCLAALPAPAQNAVQPSARDTAAKVWLSQVTSAGKPLGPEQALACTDTACHADLSLKVGRNELGFSVAVTFAAEGIYVALQPVPGNPNQVMEFGDAFPGPIFIGLRGGQRLTHTLRLMLFAPGDTGLSHATGRYEPDAYLRVDYVAAPAQGSASQESAR
jgi:hypothetical protein